LQCVKTTQCEIYFDIGRVVFFLSG